jgi:stearoyl-CoA desaturase (Delta-9 desaturase)
MTHGAVPRRLDTVAITLFSLVTVAALTIVPLYGYLVGYTALDWALFGVLYVVTGLGITVGYHRLVSHRSFGCHPIVKAALLIAGAWALQNSALKWAADHRRHHAECDTDADPYNARAGFWYSHCGWLFVNGRQAAREKYTRGLRDDRLIVWQDRLYVPIVLSGLAIPSLIGMLAHGWTGAVGAFLLAGVARLFFVLNSTFCINSVCHLWGRQPHGTADSSRDSWWVSLFTFGEGYHNYHHMHPTDYRNGVCWYNFDPSKWLIFGLAKARLAFALRRSQRGERANVAAGSGLCNT